MKEFPRLRKTIHLLTLLLCVFTQSIFAKTVEDNTDYYKLAESGSVAEITQAFKRRPDLKSLRFGLYDETFLMLALRNDRDLDVIKTIIKGECSVNDTTSDKRTVFMYAAQYSSNPEILEYLIKSGTLFNIGTKGRVQKIDDHGMTAYDYAAKSRTPG